MKLVISLLCWLCCGWYLRPCWAVVTRGRNTAPRSDEGVQYRLIKTRPNPDGTTTNLYTAVYPPNLEDLSKYTLGQLRQMSLEFGFEDEEYILSQGFTTSLGSSAVCRGLSLSDKEEAWTCLKADFFADRLLDHPNSVWNIYIFVHPFLMVFLGFAVLITILLGPVSQLVYAVSRQLRFLLYGRAALRREITMILRTNQPGRYLTGVQVVLRWIPERAELETVEQLRKLFCQL